MCYQRREKDVEYVLIGSENGKPRKLPILNVSLSARSPTNCDEVRKFQRLEIASWSVLLPKDAGWGVFALLVFHF